MAEEECDTINLKYNVIELGKEKSKYANTLNYIIRKKLISEIY